MERIRLKISRYGEAGHEIHKKPAGSVMTVAFELEGQPFTALNGGPNFKFNEAISFEVNCATQAEVDYYWGQALRGRRQEGAAMRLAQGQVRRLLAIVPSVFPDLFSDPGSEKSARAMTAMLKMKKLDIAEIERAYAG